MTKLSVNINKIATLRNARGNDFPNVVKFAKEIEGYGGQGITVHPRPDERHITYKDVYDLTKVVTTEFNVEGNPNPKFIDLVLATKPHQVTLVPDSVDAITSNAGWDTIKHKDFLTEVISEFKAAGIRTSIFVDPDKKFIEGAKVVNTDRIELYTEDFARGFSSGNLQAVQPYIESAEKAIELDLGVNAGHDLSLDNIEFFKKEVPGLLEVSIGQALVVESLYYGMENVVNMYLNKLSK